MNPDMNIMHDFAHDFDYNCLYKNYGATGYIYYLFVTNKVNKNGFVSDFASNGQISPLSRHIFFDKYKYTLSCNTNSLYSFEDLGKIWKSFVVDSNFVVCRSFNIDFQHLDPFIKNIFTSEKYSLTSV